MREILFRGKEIKTGKWVYGSYSFAPRRKGAFGQIISDLDKEKHYIVSKTNYEYWEVCPETVGEYTGLTDKNGKKVFEGDIFKTYFESYTHSWEEVGVVTEFCGAYGIESADGKHFRAFINESVYTRSYEVIGNIHDNPELLEVEK